MANTTAVVSRRVLLPHLLFLLFVSTADGFNRTDSSIPGCSIVDCGDGTKISYPFWIPDQNSTSTAFCGYPEFKVTCNYTSPSFRTLSDNYTVRSIYKGNRTLFLTDSDVIGNDCPKARHNVSLGTNSSLSLGDSNTYLVFFFNCDLNLYTGPRPIPQGNVASCLQNVSGISYVFDNDYLKEYGSLSRACDYPTVVSPVLKGPLLNDGNLADSFGRAMNGGFQLVWKDPEREDCKGCEESGGYCGYDNSTGGGLLFQCFCKDGHFRSDCNRSDKNPRTSVKIGIGVGGIVFGLALCSIIFCIFKHGMWVNLLDDSSDQNVEAFLTSHGPLAVQRYSYSEVKQMTASCSVKLGHGGFGTVYKGNLQDGTPVAVKLLKDAKGTGEEFINEVASIGRTNHINVVSLLGYCYESANRALIYEYMPNGSLEKYLFIDGPSASSPLGWEQLHRIALGVARGLEYLHRGCNNRMVHFDIKPHNILLDEDFRPKISDFGLAKLYKSAESVFSTVYVRGTAGYMAPEVFSRNFGVVSSKSDVYSYGMMVLEMVGRRRNVNTRVQNSSELYFPHWIYEHLDDDCYRQACRVTVGSEEIARKMILVGLWCIQTNPSSRPSISKVVEMLEGSVHNLEIPPKPYICSPEKSSHVADIDSFPTMSGSL